MIKADDNCIPPYEILKSNKEISTPFFSKNDDIKNDLHLTLGDFLEEKETTTLFSFFGDDKEKCNSKNGPDELLVALTRREGKPYIQTGNYIGKFRHKGVDFEIGSRFGEAFLKRMLNFANDVYLDDIDVFGEQANKSDFSKFILYYLFVQSLEKAFLLGLPRAYQSVLHHEMRLKGRLDINRFIKQDIPFVGKIASVSRDLCEVQVIVDVLHKAVALIERDGNAMTKNITHIKPHLREAKSGDYVSRQTIVKAQSSKALLNPIFAPYKKVLRYAEYIIRLNGLQESATASKDSYFGFLVNVAELFEIYVTKLLQREFPDWNVSSPKIELYGEQFDKKFYARKIIPDIVMQRGSQVLVFDTKYKQMLYRGKGLYGMGDVDREDFFQINTYMSYYQQQGKTLLCGGLLYPLSGEHQVAQCHSAHWLGNTAVGFIVDGIVVGEDIKTVKTGEKDFIQRVRKLLNKNEGLHLKAA